MGDFQYAFLQCGTEQIIHRARELLSPTPVPNPTPSQAAAAAANITASAATADDSDNVQPTTSQGELLHAVLVDCTNAFNTVRRQAIQEVLMRDEHSVR